MFLLLGNEGLSSPQYVLSSGERCEWKDGGGREIEVEEESSFSFLFKRNFNNIG